MKSFALPNLVWFIGVIGAGAAYATPASAPPHLKIEVTGVADDRGAVVVSLCTRAEFLDHDCRLTRSEPARTPVVVIRFDDVAPGSYAAVAFHDHRRRGHVLQGALGVPLEGVGFSRNPRLWRKPTFDEVAFEVQEGAQSDINVRLRFEPAAASGARRLTDSSVATAAREMAR